MTTIDYTQPFASCTAFTLWRLEPHPTRPDTKPIKVPVHHDGRTRHFLGKPARHGQPAVPANPAIPLTAAVARDWVAYNRATGVGHDRPGEVGYIGLGFRPAGNGLTCLDIDDCIAGGVPNALALEMMRRFPGALIETSHSGRGMHIWFTTRQSTGRNGKDKSGALEMYSDGQFIAAGQVLGGDASTDHTDAALQLLAEYWPPRAVRLGFRPNDWGDKTPDQQAAVLAEIRSALSVLDADDRDEWIRVGQNLACLGDLGMEIWDEWSRTSDRYAGIEDLERRNVSGTGSDYRSIFARAQVGGWQNPASMEAKIQAAVAGGLFQAVAPADPGDTPVAPPPQAQRPAISDQLAARPLSFQAAAEGAIRATSLTVFEALMSVEGGSPVAYDEFLGRPVISRDGAWRPIRDSDISRLRVEFERRGFKAVSKDAMDTAIGSICDQVRFDSAIDWGNGLKWDGVPRVAGSLVRYYRTKDTPYTRAAAEYLWTALAGRCMQPGCQADMAIILIGLQGARKTSAVSAIAPFPSGFGKANLGQRDENLSRKIKGKLVVELPELRGIGSGRDVQGIRDWMTTREEAFIDKYEKFESTYPRRFVAIGTSNEDEVLDDAEGERRWLPMRVGATVDVEGLERDRDQLWAEGIAMWRAGGIRWQEAERLARDEHGEFKVGDEWSRLVAEWLDQPCNSAGGPLGSQFQQGLRKDHPVRIADVLLYGLRVPAERINHSYKLRVAKILASLNYVIHVDKVGGRSERVYRRS